MENNTGKTRVLADQHIEHYDGLNRDEIEVGSGEYTLVMSIGNQKFGIPRKY